MNISRMNQSLDFFLARADEAAEEAKLAKLDNVRDRALRSEKTWRGLADQAQKAADAKIVLELAKQREAEALLVAAAGDEPVNGE